MIRRKEREIKVIYVIVLALFAAFLAIPVVRLLIESFVEEAGVGLSYYTEVLTERGFMKALTNSITVSFVSALISTVLAFILAYSIQGVSDSELINLLEESGLSAKLEDIDYNLDRSIYKNFDETGFEPSGGEGQKIAIARAVFKNAPIVVLDEPTSAMDPRAEYELYQRFHKMVEGKTAFFISHRMSSTKFCDRIVVINRGRITEQGTHEELMRENGNYAELFRMQAQFYND